MRQWILIIAGIVVLAAILVGRNMYQERPSPDSMPAGEAASADENNFQGSENESGPTGAESVSTGSGKMSLQPIPTDQVAVSQRPQTAGSQTPERQTASRMQVSPQAEGPSGSAIIGLAPEAGVASSIGPAPEADMGVSNGLAPEIGDTGIPGLESAPEAGFSGAFGPAPEATDPNPNQFGPAPEASEAAPQESVPE